MLQDMSLRRMRLNWSGKRVPIVLTSIAFLVSILGVTIVLAMRSLMREAAAAESWILRDAVGQDTRRLVEVLGPPEERRACSGCGKNGEDGEWWYYDLRSFTQTLLLPQDREFSFWKVLLIDNRVVQVMPPTALM